MKVNFRVRAAQRLDTTPAPEVGRVLSYQELRLLIGVLAFALPIVLFISHFFFGSGQLPGSISGFYYTPMRNYFVGTLCALGVFLFSYRYAPRDNSLSTVAAVLVLLVALSPTASPGTNLNPGNVLHLTAAALFFATLAYFSYFLFTLSDGSGSLGNRKALRNTIYRACGIVIAAALVIAAVLSRTSLHLLFWWESIAVWAFSFSWLIKSETLLFRDTDGAEPSK
jgi:hypothetical protein